MAKRYYDRGTRDIAELKREETVRIIPINNERSEKRIKVPIEDGVVYRRNRSHFRKTNELGIGCEADVRGQDGQKTTVGDRAASSSEDLDVVEPRQYLAGENRRTRSGRKVKLPERFREFEMN